MKRVIFVACVMLRILDLYATPDVQIAVHDIDSAIKAVMSLDLDGKVSSNCLNDIAVLAGIVSRAAVTNRQARETQVKLFDMLTSEGAHCQSQQDSGEKYGVIVSGYEASLTGEERMYPRLFALAYTFRLISEKIIPGYVSKHLNGVLPPLGESEEARVAREIRNQDRIKRNNMQYELRRNGMAIWDRLYSDLQRRSQDVNYEKTVSRIADITGLSVDQVKNKPDYEVFHHANTKR